VPGCRAVPRTGRGPSRGGRPGQLLRPDPALRIAEGSAPRDPAGAHGGETRAARRCLGRRQHMGKSSRDERDQPRGRCVTDATGCRFARDTGRGPFRAPVSSATEPAMCPTSSRTVRAVDRRDKMRECLTSHHAGLGMTDAWLLSTTGTASTATPTTSSPPPGHDPAPLSRRPPSRRMSSASPSPAAPGRACSDFLAARRAPARTRISVEEPTGMTPTMNTGWVWDRDAIPPPRLVCGQLPTPRCPRPPSDTQRHPSCRRPWAAVPSPR
jgi:hypothetical protein